MFGQSFRPLVLELLIKWLEKYHGDPPRMEWNMSAREMNERGAGPRRCRVVFEWLKETSPLIWDENQSEIEEMIDRARKEKKE
jgi:hypothetical protein